MKVSRLLKLAPLFVIAGMATLVNAQYNGYNLDYIIYTEGTTNPIEDIEPIAEDDLTNDTTLDIVNWNVDWLGVTGMSSYDHGTRMQHIGNVANTLVDLDADVYALQEVVVSDNDGNALEDLVDTMNGLAGFEKYDGVYSKYYSYWWEGYDASYPPQCLAYIWKKETVSVRNDSALLQDESAARNFGYGRLPFLLDADVTINGKTQRYMFINLHLKAKTGFSEVRYVSMNILRGLLNANFYQNNVVLIGDYNVADKGGAVGEISDWGLYDDNEEDGLTDYVHACGTKRNSQYNDIEHILVSTELFDELAYVPESERSTKVAGTKIDGYSSHYAFLGKLFVHEESGDTDPETNPVFNNSTTFTMVKQNYQVLVDSVNSKGLNGHDYSDNSEDYYGASAYYGNFDIRSGSWDNSVFSSWQDAAKTGIGEELLPTKFPAAEEDGTIYSVGLLTYNGSTYGAENFQFVCSKAAPNPEFSEYDATTATEYALQQEGLEIFPNPTRGVFQVKNGSASGNIYVVDLSGKVVFEKQLSAGSDATTVNLGNINKGIYIVKLQTESQVKTQMVVVK